MVKLFCLGLICILKRFTQFVKDSNDVDLFMVDGLFVSFQRTLCYKFWVINFICG